MNKTKIKSTKITQRGDEEFANGLISLELEQSVNEADNLDHLEDNDNDIEGKLAIDVYETPTTVTILAPVAGVEINDLEVTIEDDVLTIAGHRKHLTKNINREDYLTQECFWGKFSRSIILPPNLNSSEISANFKRGILKVEVAKRTETPSMPIHISN